jgi:hypothetical protein
MNSRRSVILIVLCTMLAAGSGGAEKTRNAGGRESASLLRTAGSPAYTWLDINQISTVLRNTGIADIDPTQNNSGFVYPKGSNKTAIYESGLLWAARVAGDPQVRVGGSAFTSGLQPGKLLSPGVAEDPNLPKNRIYRVRPDYRSADLSSEVRDEGSSASEVRAAYERDWTEWPVGDGAPYEDVNGNGAYDPDVDIAGVKGASQTIWFVANDNNSTNTANLYGTPPLGVECQVTIWAYAQEGPLGNMLFKSYLLINKSTVSFDSMYVCQWVDPDLGNAYDDLVGCDTSLSLGFVYNANIVDATYGSLPPPSAGFDFFQGPRVTSPGSSAIFRGKRIDGFRNLPMTAFFYFINSDPTLADPTRGDPAGASQFYNYMRGKVGLTGQYFLDPQGRPTTFTLTGDPVAGTGWLDGVQFRADDRRMGLSSGPFTMAPGDTQEIVVAEICAGAMPGVDRLAAVGLLKFYDKVAQLAYDNFFELPSPPPAPRFAATELDRQIILNWSINPAAVEATETSNVRGFKFQGYNVFQIPSASASMAESRKIAVFDIVDGVTRITDQVFDASNGVVASKVVQLGTDNGLQRYLRVTGDAFNGMAPLINGVRYYFAVTSYSYSADPNAVPNNLENPLQILTVVPHTNNPGVHYAAASGDTVRQVQHTGPSDGTVTPLAVDPGRFTGKRYSVTFADREGETVWNLVNVSSGDTILRGQTNQTGDNNYAVTDGMQVKVIGPPPGMKNWSIPSGTRRFSPVGGFTGLGLEGFSDGGNPDAAQDLDNGTIGMAGNFAFGAIATTLLPTNYHNVVLKLAAVDTATLWNPTVTPTDTNFSRAYRWIRSVPVGEAAAQPEFAPWIINRGPGYPYQDYNYGVPFSAWDMESNPPRRLAVGPLENNVEGGKVDGRYWPGTTEDDNSVIREFAFIFDAPYSSAPDPALAVGNLSGSTTPMMWVMVCSRRADVPWETGDQFLITANHVNSPADAFAFTAPAVTYDAATAKEDVNRITVFPNPYYGVNTEELNKYNRFVVFSHLPQEAVLRIFNLAGVQVREIRKNSASQFERWDLANESGLPVGSGLYIVRIDMPALGTMKILKLAVVQEQQILDRY